MPGQMPGNCALSSAGWSVNGYDYLPARFSGARRAFFRAHPRFFEFGLALCLDGAVKPYRLLFPALAPAERAGLRLLRAERASGRASFRLALPLRRRLPPRAVPLDLPAVLLSWPFPLRWLTAEADGLDFRTPGVTLAEWLRALPFPLD
jgi:hypothetical protein